MLRMPRRSARDTYSTLLRQERSHREHARDLFYQALRLHVPAVMHDLEQGGLPRVQPEQIQRYANADPETWREIAPLGPFVEAWAKRHHLFKAWVVRDAIDYVLALRNGDFVGDDAPCIRTSLTSTWITGLNGTAIVWPVEFDLPCFVWHTGIQSRADFETLVRRKFEEDLKRQLDSGERLALAMGMSKFNRPELWRDMQRVVQRVVLGWTPAQILRWEGHPGCLSPEAERAVRKSINSGCTLLDLQGPPPGAPKKSRSRCVRVHKTGT